MRNLIKFVLVLLMALPCTANAQELWNGLKKGMSVEEVKQVFPDAVVPTDPEKVNGDRELLRLQSVDFYGTKFRALLLFDKKKLNLIKLQPLGNFTEKQAIDLYFMLFEEHKKVHGEPASRELRSMSNKDGKHIFMVDIWENATGNTVLLLYAEDGVMSFMHVTYGPKR